MTPPCIQTALRVVCIAGVLLAMPVASAHAPSQSRYDIPGGKARFDRPAGHSGVGAASPAGKLHVGGQAFIGNTALACVSGTAGALRASGGGIQYCNGSAWVSLDAGQAPPPTAPADPPCASSPCASRQRPMSRH
jgi:hypothetical protein